MTTENFFKSFVSISSGSFLVRSILIFLRFIVFFSLKYLASAFIIFIPEQNFSIDKKIFFSTKYNEVNVRNGPGKNHLIIYKIFNKGYPLVLLDEFDSWKKVTDFKNRVGWISMSQLSKDKFGITNNKSILYMFPNAEQKIVAELGYSLTFKITKCRAEWCKIDVDGISGWIQKSKFWGPKD